MLSAEEIQRNEAAYREQVGLLIDLEKAEFRYNSEWLSGLTYREIGEQADQFSVADFIARDNIRRRLDAGRRVSLREMLYPLMQGYDSVAINADVELGGTDQRFNLLAGRTLQEYFGQGPQGIVMNPLIIGLDGRKMSSSWGNTVPLTAEPADMYGRVMSMDDGAVIEYFTLCTRVPLDEIAEIRTGLDEGGNPRDAKMRLAREIVTLYHGSDAADAAERTFVETFQKGAVPEDVPAVARNEGERFADALVRVGVVASKSELSRLLAAGAVTDTDTGEKLTELQEDMDAPRTLKVGKRRFARLMP
jgi:tyrosyl-tRNA synthetase